MSTISDTSRSSDRYSAQAWSAPTEMLRTDRPLPRPANQSGSAQSSIDQGRFWVGAVLAAGAAALTGVISMIIANGILGIPIVWGNGGSVDLVHISSYGLLAAAAALVVAGLYDAMIHFAPRPGVFFGWLGGLGTLLAALIPFTTPAPLQSQIVLGGMNVLVGAVILALVPSAAISARRRS